MVIIFFYPTTSALLSVYIKVSPFSFFIMSGSSSTPKPSPNDKIYVITNIKSYVPLLLDLERLNYNSWKKPFKTHYIGYKVYGNLNDTSQIEDDPKWETLDNIVKQWLYDTLTQRVLQSNLKPTLQQQMYGRPLKICFMRIKR